MTSRHAGIDKPVFLGSDGRTNRAACPDEETAPPTASSVASPRPLAQGHLSVPAASTGVQNWRGPGPVRQPRGTRSGRLVGEAVCGCPAFTRPAYGPIVPSAVATVDLRPVPQSRFVMIEAWGEGISHEQWSVLKSLLPVVMLGRPPLSRRRLIDGIRWRVPTGVPWRDRPSEYGPWQMIYGLGRALKSHREIHTRSSPPLRPRAGGSRATPTT
ncbi:transposase [Streptomyces sp. NPDC005752]|uniref:transposase n=1 Tax=Streptomyces sp. NPDC005752 TaxID=3157065 RepID=UPI0033E6554F